MELTRTAFICGARALAGPLQRRIGPDKLVRRVALVNAMPDPEVVVSDAGRKARTQKLVLRFCPASDERSQRAADLLWSAIIVIPGDGRSCHLLGVEQAGLDVRKAVKCLPHRYVPKLLFFAEQGSSPPRHRLDNCIRRDGRKQTVGTVGGEVRPITLLPIQPSRLMPRTVAGAGLRC